MENITNLDMDNILEEKEDFLKRVDEAEKEKGDLLSDELMNFFWAFPISPLYWIDYALGNDFEEIKKAG